MRALQSYSMKIVLLALCGFFISLRVPSALSDPETDCQSCRLAAKAIETELQATPPRKRRAALDKLMLDNEVCNMLPPGKGSKLTSACVKLFDSHYEDFYLALLSQGPHLLDSLLCYQKSTACVGVNKEDEEEEQESFGDTESIFVDEHTQASHGDNEEEVHIAQHSQTAPKDEF